MSGLIKGQCGGRATSNLWPTLQLWAKTHVKHVLPDFTATHEKGWMIFISFKACDYKLILGKYLKGLIGPLFYGTGDFSDMFIQSKFKVISWLILPGTDTSYSCHGISVHCKNIQRDIYFSLITKLSSNFICLKNRSSKDCQGQIRKYLMEENHVEPAFINGSWSNVGLADKGQI